MGEGVDIGDSVSNVFVGDRVVSSTYLSCGICKHCRNGRETLCENLDGRLGITIDGGFAQYMRIRSKNLIQVPEAISN
jgi:D-arabinose 1-dehydrogenase-like Zn-dependent alcohol dehydrogenase